MKREDYRINYPLSAVPLAQFAIMMGKSHDAAKSMAKQGKLPIIEYKDPKKKKEDRANELWVSLTEFNRGMDSAFDNLSEEKRKAWLLWLGL